VDREIDPKERRRTQLRRWALAAGVVIALWLAASWGFGLIRPSLKRSMVRTAVVDQGAVDASLSATGVVVPETEQVVSSPVDARLLRVVRKAGSTVKSGDAIV